MGDNSYAKLCWLLAAAAVIGYGTAANIGERDNRPGGAPQQQQDQAAGAAEGVRSSGIRLLLEPLGQVKVDEGRSLRLQCEVINKPEGSQIQWYYIVRSDDGQSFKNFTIIANEQATINNDKYHVWTTPKDKHSLTVKDLTPEDSGEYCCFLFISYSETYRNITIIEVEPRPDERPSAEAMLDRIIEEAVEQDIETELGTRLNLTMIKNNEQAQTLIHNATKEIKSLLHIDAHDATTFSNDSTRTIVSRRMNSMNSEVKTVVTSLLSKITSVDTTIARALTGPRKMGGVSYVGGASNTPAWRRIYNEYRERVNSEDGSLNSVDNDVDASAVPAVPAPAADADSQEISNSVSQYEDVSDDSRQEVLEEMYNTVEPPITAREQGSTNQQPVHKCQYQLIINEFDPNQCPSIASPRPAAAAAMYYEEDNRRAAAGGRAAADSEQLVRLENRLLDEMVNAKIVNETVNMHDTMLQKTERKLEEQTGSLDKMAATIGELQSKLDRSDEEKRDMEDKLTEVMVNLLEVNKRLDVALSRSLTEPYDKEVGVESAAQTVTCDRHPNVTHYKDCADVEEAGNSRSGVYYVRPIYSACPVPVWCDLQTYPGGWTVVQRREGGKVNFNRDWDSYRHGFGEVTGEHWLGNDNLFLLSNQAEYVLRVDLWDFYGSRVYAEYGIFRVEGERDQYRLTTGNYSGTAGDGLKTHNRQKFSAPDRDHDLWQDYHCAREWEGAWWFTNCWSSYLNGRYYNVSDPPYNGISWREWKEEQLYKSEMKVRPVWRRAESGVQAEDERAKPEMESDETEGDGEDGEDVQNDEPRHAPTHHRPAKLNRAVSGK